MDDPDEIRSYTSFSRLAADDGQGAALASSRLRVDGLHCAACAVLIEQALLRVPGVADAQVNYAARRAVVRWDPVQTRPSQMVSAVHAAGYLAFPDAAVATPQGHGAAERAAVDSRRATWRLFVAGFCMMQVMMYAAPLYFTSPAEIGFDVVRLLFWASWLLSLPVVLFAATPFYRGAWQSLKQRRIGMDVPVALGVLVTFVVSTGVAFDPQAVGPQARPGLLGHEVYFDSLTMFVAFLLAGRRLEQRARQQAAQALDSALNRLPAAVERAGEDGQPLQWVTHAKLAVGDRIRIAAGQAFAADGTLLEGRTEVDESLLSGEARPLPRGPGDSVLAGSFNVSNPVMMRVDKLGADTRYERIVGLMQRAIDERPAVVRMADRLASPFLWLVLALAAIGGVAWSFIDPSRAVWVAVAVLIVTCPCALSLAAPSAMVAAAGALARRGVLVQRFDAFEALAQADIVVFDKTGTLTDECPRVVGVRAGGAADQAALWRIAAGLAAHSHHPLSLALVRSFDAGRPAAESAQRLARGWVDVRELAGCGIEGVDAQGQRWRLGSAAWAAAGQGVDVDALSAGMGEQSPRVWLACVPSADGDAQAPLAGFQIDEALRPDALAAVQGLREAGVDVMILSGDHVERVQQMAARLGANDLRAGASPQDKLDTVAALQAAGRKVVVVGDGINDAPVLARAHSSFAMGHGAALAQARADFIVLGSRPGDVLFALQLARRTLRVVRQNLAWALAYNLISLPLALAGWLPPWLAGLGMACSSLLVVGNAVRLGRGSSDNNAVARPAAVGQSATPAADLAREV